MAYVLTASLLIQPPETDYTVDLPPVQVYVVPSPDLAQADDGAVP
jgi:hypothetical protein